MAIYDINGNIISTGDVVINGKTGVNIPKVHSINHRGFNTIAPENTIPAFKLSKTNGFDMVETDVQFTSDNVPVLLHDSTINRTARNTDGTEISTSIDISSITYAQALEYDFGIWKSSTYAGTKIPTLNQFLYLCKALSLHPYIEIKNNTSFTNAQLQIIVDAVYDNGMENNISYISFTSSYLSGISALQPGSRIGVLSNTLNQAAVNTATNLRNSGADVFISCGYSPSALPDVSIAKNAHIPLEIWTVGVSQWILDMDAYITGVTSNNLIASEILYNNNIT